MSSIVPLILVENTPTFTDSDVTKIWYGHFGARPDQPVGVFIDHKYLDWDEDTPSIFLTKDELKELIKIIEENN